MQNKIISPEKCTGCSACHSACPTGAISMILNASGFYEPLLNPELCIKCGKCLSACPVEKTCANEKRSSYYGWHTDAELLYHSTSGGAFRAFADKIRSQNGVVYGAVYTADFTQVVFSDSDTCDLSQFQKSKYIVSNPQDSYKRIKAHLEAGRYVLFSGTPCQVAGLHCFLNKNYDRLLTVDFVCGGMPSLRFWQEHKELLERKYKSPITSVDFRSKRKGWGKGYLDIRFENGKQYFTRDYLDSYYNCFYDEHISVRRSCLSCEFRDRHFADITIADFWGYANAGVSDVSRGISLVVANSPKGEAFIHDTADFQAHPLDPRHSEYAFSKAAATEAAVKKHHDFFALAEKVGFEQAVKQMCPATRMAHIKKYMKLILGRK